MPKPVPIKKIVVKRKYFPRFRVDKPHVERIREAIRDGEYIPPILVGNDGDRYVVIDGVHRFTAAKLERAKEIEVVLWPETDKNVWLLDAARLNSRPELSQEERARRKESIKQMWQEGLRDTKKIAEITGYSVQSVQRVLKPLRDQERSQRNAAIRWLAKEGYTQRRIAKEVGVSQVRVSQVLKETATWPKLLDTEIIDKKGSCGLNIFPA